MSNAIVPIKRALLSVFDKSGMEEFAKELARLSGFGSAARMNRAFARVLGMTPREYRLLHRPA